MIIYSNYNRSYPHKKNDFADYSVNILRLNDVWIVRFDGIIVAEKRSFKEVVEFLALFTSQSC